MTSEYVPTPGKPLRKRAGIGNTAKSRAHKRGLIDYLRSPPDDYDGTNRKLSEVLGVSERQVSRLLVQLVAEGRIKTDYTLQRKPGGGLYTMRYIQILKGNN